MRKRGQRMSNIEHPAGSEVARKPTRKRNATASGFVSDPSIVDLAFDAPAAVAAGIQGIGRGVSGLISRVGSGGESQPSGPGENVISTVSSAIGGGMSRAATAVSDVTGSTLSAATQGIGHLAANAGSVASSASQALAGAGEVAGDILSAAAGIAGAASEGAADAAGAVIGGLGDLVN